MQTRTRLSTIALNRREMSSKTRSNDRVELRRVWLLDVSNNNSDNDDGIENLIMLIVFTWTRHDRLSPFPRAASYRWCVTSYFIFLNRPIVVLCWVNKSKTSSKKTNKTNLFSITRRTTFKTVKQLIYIFIILIRVWTQDNTTIYL